MKKGIWLSLLVLVSLLACKSKKQEEKTETKLENAIQYPLLPFSFRQTSQYCGGAAPPEDLLAELASPKPMSPRTLYFRNSAELSKIIKYQITRPDTLLAFKPGNYEVYLYSNDEIENLVKDYPEKDRKCARKWLSRKMTSFTINSGTERVSIVIHFGCDPCVEPAP